MLLANACAASDQRPETESSSHLLCVTTVKANPEPGIIQVLAALGAGFDCASGGELALALGLGVAPSAIIYAHPCKLPQDLAMAREVSPTVLPSHRCGYKTKAT